MMRHTCSTCNGPTRILHGPDFECRRCFLKNSERHIIGGPLIFDENVSVQVASGDFNITEKQAIQLEDRLDELFPKRRQDQRFSKISIYIRMLIMNDIEAKLKQAAKEEAEE